MDKKKLFKSIDVHNLYKMFLNGTKLIDENYQYIDELNVFPVPDGDTGTNLKLTTSGAVDAVKDKKYDDLFLMAKDYARGLLMNARGNSGVIFSQIIKGFSLAIKEGTSELTPSDLIKCLLKAKETAYSAVNNPVEGTILTVIRETGEKVSKKKYDSVNALFEDIVKEAKISLANTPKLLKDLKDAGVVDSGGYGLVKYLQGMLESLSVKAESEEKLENEINDYSKKIIKINNSFDDKNDGFGYCTEFIMIIGSRVSAEQAKKEKIMIDEFKKQLSKMGDSLVVVIDDNIVKVHIHSITPYKILEYAAKFGEFSKIKFENMTLQFLEKNPGVTLESIVANNKKEKPKKLDENGFGIIITSPSTELEKIFKNEFSIDGVICDEEKGNPSTQNFISKINDCNKKNIVLLVDDSNAMLAANEAKKLLEKHNIIVAYTQNIIGTYKICKLLNKNCKFNDIEKKVTNTIKDLVFAKLSKSVKMVKYSHISVNKDDYIGIVNKKIVASSIDFNISIKNLLDIIADKKKKATTIYISYGKDLNIKQQQYIEKYVTNNLNLKCIPIAGKQKTYSLIIGVE